MVLSGVVKLNLKPPEKSTFLVTLRRLAEHHKLLPDWLRITERIVPDEELAFGRPGSGVSPSKKFGRLVSMGNDSERRHVTKLTPDDWDRRSG